MRALIGASEVERGGGKFSVMPFTDVTDPVAVCPQQPRIRFSPRCFESRKTFVAVARHPLAGEQRGAADATDGRGDGGSGESQSLARQPIQFRGLNNRIPRYA